jgi:excisionase family DNA binding protein
MHSNIPTKTILLLRRPEAAEALGISERKLDSLAASGEIPYIRIGRCVCYPLAELDRWIESQLRERNDDPR